MLRAMQFRASKILSVAGLGLCVLGGCAYGEVRQVVRAQFASELDCPEVQLKRRLFWYAEDAIQYKVTGCGVTRTYTCPAGATRVSYDSPPCTFVEGDLDAPKTVPMKDDDGNEIHEDGTLMEDAPSDESEDTGSSDDTSGGEEAPAPSEDSDSSKEPSGDADGEASGSGNGHGASGKASGGVKLKLGK